MSTAIAILIVLLVASMIANAIQYQWGREEYEGRRYWEGRFDQERKDRVNDHYRIDERLAAADEVLQGNR